MKVLSLVVHIFGHTGRFQVWLINILDWNDRGEMNIWFYPTTVS